MDEITSGLDPDELMDLDEADGSDLDDDDEELIDDPITSPFLLSSGPGSTATSVASSPVNEDFSPPFNFTGKPLNVKRGRGRPRREGGKPLSSRASRGGLSGITRVRKPRPPVSTKRAGSRNVRQPDRSDFEMSIFTPSPVDESSFLDPETGSFLFPDRDKSTPIAEELPYFPEHWTGKVCAFCNLSERSQLGQGEMLRLNCPEDFSPLKVATEQNLRKALQMSDRDSGDKSPRGPVTCRRQKSFNKCRNPTNSEYVDELTIIGFNEVPDVSLIFDTNGQFFVHRSCALWSCGVTKAENSALLNVGQVVLQSSSKKCSFCNHFGASVICNTEGCSKIYHLPCATAAGAFQELVSVTTFCSNHLDQVAMLCESSVCFTCRTLGDVANLMYCSTCGAHYHGTCVGLAQLPSVRAGWQCRRCRCCQVCRITGDESKLMSCEQCDKVYHAGCQRPIVTSIPKYGWKCRCCRVCGDCGSRTPGAGLSSRWHAHYTVCDSCYQQRNKGYSCPLCHKAYRAHAHREMVQCTNCKKFVHGTCDPEADLGTYHQKREANPEYEYVCLHCKTNGTRQVTTKRASTEDPGDLSASQESLYDDTCEFDLTSPDELARSIGLGKGKPYTGGASKKRLAFPTGRAKGKGGLAKRSRLADLGRKRGHKAKMRGVFGVPGVGLQRPTADGRGDEEPGVENRLVLCSAKDRFILTQDICVMCGAMGTDQEGCLIACVQCGQCYHPYCLNVKVTKVILQKGWRCLDCTVCEGCGQRNDEGRLILCDDCDVSYHIYCMDPPLEYVPHGNWKCKWCAVCQTCGATDPGFNCTWMNSCSECGPCASHVACPGCSEPYSEGELIIQCVQCERWLHGACDHIRTEEDAEKCAEDGYNCMLCRPRDVPPPHLIPPPIAPKPPTPTKSPEITKNTNYFIDGVYLSEFGHSLIKSLALENHGTRKKRKKIPTVQDKEAGIMATIESVVAGGSADNMLEDSAKLELVDIKDEPQELYKEGMIWTKEDGPPPDGFTVFTMENGIAVLRRKRQRNLQKLGIGGFLVRMRGTKPGQDNDEIDGLQGQANLNSDPLPSDGDKPRRKPIRRKPKSKLVETFPSYLQEAFFGRDLMDVVECKKEVEGGSSDEDKDEKYRSIKLSQDELMAVAAVTAKQEIRDSSDTKENMKIDKISNIKEEEDDNTEDLKDVIGLPGDLLDTDLVNSIINEDDEELTKNTESLEALDSNMPDDSELADTLGSSGNSKDTKDELSDILGPHFNLESISNINSKDVEDIFKGVLTDESQESQESNAFPLQGNNLFNGSVQQALPPHPVIAPPIRPTTLPAVNQSNLNSPVSFPPPSPYHSEYSNSPQFSPAFSEPPSPWVNVADTPEIDSTNVGVQSTYNQRSSEKMKADESLGNAATISAVLYANMNHPEWKKEFPVWSDRYKQIIKKWRTLSQDQKAPYLQHARDNRSQLRMKKAQQSQSSKEAAAATPTSPSVAKPSPAIAAALVSTLQTALAQPPTMGNPPPAAITEDQEKIALQHKSAKEAEQERAWKQLQAMRQQQAQQQQHVIHEQRVQDEIDEVSREEAAMAQRAIARVQSQITADPMQQFLADQQSPLPAATGGNNQDGNPAARHFLGHKSPPFPHPLSGQQPGARPPTPSHSPHDFAPSPSPAPEGSDTYAQPPANPKPNFAPRLPADSFAGQVGARPPFGLVRPPLQGFANAARPDHQDLGINRQLRELLQRQQFKRLDEPTPPTPGKAPPRGWPAGEQGGGGDAGATFRQPLPPSVARPRVPAAGVGRPAAGVAAARPGVLDARAQGVDPRMRLIFQQQQRLHHAGAPPPQFARFAAVRPPAAATVEQYEQLLLHRQQQAHAQGGPRAPLGQPVGEGGPNEEGIPDNVTAELEKLEQETGTMVELQGVSEILGGLGEDEDELLAEMGADFNILEYADPELEALTGGKTNILDLELEEEPMKKDNKRDAPKTATTTAQQAPVSASGAASVIKKEGAQLPSMQAQEALQPPLAPPPMAVPQAQQQMPLARPAVAAQAPAHQPQFLTPQQIHQQMLHQVQQAAAQGRPMPPGSKMQTPDGIIGVVMPNNTVHLQVPPNYQHKLLLIQQLQKHQMRIGQSNPRMSLPVGANQQVAGMTPGPRVAAPPPPPPYPGPPPPYPGSAQQPTGLRMGPGLFPIGHFHPATPQGYPHLQRKPLLLEEQPLLLEDLLEQEKREQEKLQNRPSNQEVSSSTGVESESALLSDHDFERLKADIFNSGPVGLTNNSQGNAPQQPWQQTQNRPVAAANPQPTMEITTRVQMFNANLIPAPPLPPENIISEQDKQAQMLYEQWLNHQNNVLGQQLRFYETEVQKLRKSRKSLNSKQRQLRKSGNQLTETDAAELQRIAAEQAILQKHLESSRKQSRQHGMLIQEYRNKHPAKQRPPCPEQIHSPLGPPASSPVHQVAGASQSSPMMSPMHSPGPLVSPSPAAGPVQAVLPTPGNGSGMSPGQAVGMLPSPRMGTPHSQSEESPGPAQSPSQVCLPPPVPRMTSPQHRRLVTSPGAVPQMRFVNNPLQQRVRMQSPMQNFQQKPGTPSPLHSPTSQQININQLQLQKQLQHHTLLQQQQQQQQQQGLDSSQNDPNVLHSQRAVQLLQHRNLIARQQGAQQQQTIGQPQPLTPQQHQMMLQQQKQLAQQQQQQIAQLQAARLQQQQQNPPQSPLPPKSPMVNQQIMSPHSMPPSPMQMPPKSPMVSSYGNNQPNPNSPAARSPAFHQGVGQPPSPMTHGQYQPPSSPMPRSPMVNQNQSPHGMRRPPSANSSPAMSDRPHSEENLGAPMSRTPYNIEHLIQDSMQNQNHNIQFNNDMVNQVHFNNESSGQNIFRENMQTGGGNPNNPCNPIPAPPCFGRFGYVKLGLRGGSPMWNYGRGAKRIPTPPNTTNKPEEKSNTNPDVSSVQKTRKEFHLNKVSILKKKSSTNFHGKVGSLVSTDYDNTDDSSCTPPETPPTLPSSSKGPIQKPIPRKTIDHSTKELEIHSPPENKQMDIMDYDDDTNTVLSAEVSLSSTAQNDHDDMVEMETLSQQDLAEGFSSPLESDQIPDEYLLFPGNMVVDMSDKDEEEVEEEYTGENMHIVIRSPTTSDDEFIMQGKTKKYDMVPHPDEFINREGPESPDQEDAEEEVLTNFEESDLVVIEQNKSPEDSISTKEDFEELIDEGSRKNNMTKKDNEVHKFPNTYNYTNNAQQSSQSQTASISRVTTVSHKVPPKISLISSSVVHSAVNKTNTDKIIIKPNTNPQSPKVTSIILTHNSNVRGNILSVPKIVTSVSPAITIVNASTSQIASILPSKFTVPVISASAVRQLSNVKVIDKSSSSLSLSTHDSTLPKQIFEDDSVSPDSSNCDDDKSKDSFDYKPKSASPEQEGKQPLFPKSVEIINMNSVRKLGVENKPKENAEKPPTKRIEHLQITNLVTKGHIQKHRVPSPIISKTSSPVIIHNTPELKMTAQVIQETQTHMQINATAETIHSYDGSGDTKSVVISIPSPTPSQEQMLDNIALQALENRRREFESFEDVLDMIENITAEPPAILEENIRSKEPEENKKVVDVKEVVTSKTETVTISGNAKSTIPQLSPLSQPTDLTTNMANASQQLRSLLSSLQTTSTSAGTNVESVVKNFGNKVSSSASPTAMQPIVASRIIQQAGRQSPNVSNVNTVIVPNYKQKVSSTNNSRSSPNKPQPSTTQQVTTANNNTTLNLLTSKTSGTDLMSDHAKLSTVSAVKSVQHISSSQTSQSNNVQKATTSSETQKTSLTLTAMLQNQPAASTTTKSTAESFTAASLLGSLPRTGYPTTLVQAQPNTVIPSVSSDASMYMTHSQIMSSISNMIMKNSSDNFTAATLLGSPVHLAKTSSTTSSAQTQPNVIVSAPSSNTMGSTIANFNHNSVITSNYRPGTSTNLLHTQLTRVVRAKSLDETKETKVDDPKQEPIEGLATTSEDIKASIANCLKQELASGRYSGMYTTTSIKNEDSQNALLKKLLQNTACASTQSPPPSSANTTVTASSSIATRMPIRETSFVSSPVEHSTSQPAMVTSSVATMPTQQLHIDVKKSVPPSRTPSRDELLSPQTPRSSCSQDSSLQTPPIVMKKEIPSVSLPQPNPAITSHEVKKELIDETSQHSEVSDHSRSDVQIKEEMDSLESSVEKTILGKEELKKQKRRMYQQKRRQNLILNKELAGQPKKRPRKNSKIEEDYDTYIDSVLTQLRQLPTMNVSEPVLNRNYGIVAVIGASDMLKLGSKNYSSQFGDLVGSYGNADLPGFSDFYSTKPYGNLDPLPEKPPASTQRGFYDVEFPLIRFDSEDPKKFDMFCREDTPDSILSSSSPECMQMEPINRFLGLRLISDDEEDDKEETKAELKIKGRISPVVPMIRPIPIKLKAAGGLYLRELANNNKENIDTELLTKTKSEQKSDIPVKDSGNVTVTLTLTSSAAEDIMGVLRDLANILHIPAPTSYQIVERTSTPPGQKLGLYRTKGRDGKEGAPIDIQSILNGDAKFCKHCDVVILNNMIRRKVSDLPFLAKDTELLSDGDELYFCSSTCYMQFALTRRSPSISEDKAAEIIDHLSQKDKLEEKHKSMDSFDSKSIIAQRLALGNKEIKKEFQSSDVKDFSSYFQNFDNKIGKFQDNMDFKHHPSKIYKNVRYKFWIPDCLQPIQKHKKPTDKEIMELLYRLQITVTPAVMPEDTRKCMFCQGIGDGVADGPARLLNFEVDKWVHLNCGLWSDGVYETVNGALMNLENAISMSLTTTCVYCSRVGATIRCFKNRCSSVYHLNCAVKDHCVFHKNKTVYCAAHIPKNEKDNELTTLSVSRRVYVNRDENRQVASVMHHSDTNNILRVGSLIFLNVGHLLPHQLQNFHNSNYIYPIGYKIIRFYWSMRRMNKRCKYVCSIYDTCGRPEFGVLVQEQPEEDVEYKGATPKGAWQHILDRLATMRKDEDCLQMFPKFATGEDLFGLTEPAIVRVLESLPGIETLTDYKFKYGRNPLLELPLAVNPSGAARTEPRLRSQMHWKRPHTQRTFGAAGRPLFAPNSGLAATSTFAGELSCPYSKQFVHSKSSQYKKMKQEWKNNVYLARSKIQGLGLYAAKDLEKHTMVIEYIGEIIRTELAECREKQYDAKNRGIYMFRLDEERVVDATLSGGLARYINHSCNPNCVAEQVEVERDVRIIIFSKRRIQRGEELSYDYKFDIEDDQHKISCMCGAPNCRKWMN